MDNYDDEPIIEIVTKLKLNSANYRLLINGRTNTLKIKNHNVKINKLSKSETIDRITSYNVCYTKLLRMPITGPLAISRAASRPGSPKHAMT